MNTITRNAARACFAVLLAVALSGCSTRLGRNFDDAYAQQIQPGATKTEVRERLGRPPIMTRQNDEETWTYAFYEGRGVGGGLMDWIGFTDASLQGRGKQKRLSVTFKGDTVKEAKYKVELPVEDW